MTNFKRPFKLKNQIKNPKLLWLALLTGAMAYSTQPAFAEGSKELTDDGGDRPFLEYRNDATAGIPRRATIYVYAEDGETINLGSSAVGQGNGRIDYTAPNGTTGNCGAVGQIQDRTQEVAGPTPNTNGYTPCIINVGPTGTGVWQINFISRDATSTADPPRTTAGANWTQSDNVSWIAAWDVTVRNAGGQTIPGRTYAKYLPLNMGGNDQELNSQTFIQTRDGYQYRVGLNGLDPFGFIFFANNKGFTNGNAGPPLYQSVELPITSPISFLNPNTDDTSTDYTHKIFFNRPASDLPASAQVSGSGSTWLRVSPTDPPQPSNFQFTGIENTPNQTGTTPLNGRFTFNSPIVAPYTIVIDINRDGTFGNANDKIFNGTANVGANTVNWDATDGNGVAVPPGDLVYQSQVSLYTGEVHFPLLDAENNSNGIIIERVDPNSGAVISNEIYYDDSNLTVRGTDNPSNPRKGFRIPSSGGAHNFSTIGTVGSNSGFGNQRGIDTWVYVASNPTPLNGGLTVRQADLEITKTHEPTNPVPGGQVTYVLRVRNLGPSSLNTVGQSENIDARVTDTIPGEISNVTWTCAPASGSPAGSICRTPNGTGSTIDTRVNLPVNGVVELRVTGTLAANIASGTTIVNDRAVVERSNDVTDPNDINRQGINNNIAQDSFTVSATTADVAVVKTQTSANPVTPGQNITYNLVVTASGNTDSTNVQVADNIPAGFNFVSNSGDCTTAFPCNLGTIPTGQTRTITTTLAVPANYNGASPVTNTATVTSGNDSNPNNNTSNAQTTVTIPQTADVAIAKTQTSANPVTPGQNITYNLVVTASGNTDSTNVQVADTIPAGFNFVSNSGDCATAFPCNLGTIPTGQTRTITTTLAVPANYNGASPVTNTATVNSANDTNPNNNTATAQTTVTIPQTADVAIAKTQTSANPVTPGQNITYNLVVTASGNTDSTNVQVADNIPAGFNFVSNSGDCATAFPCNLGTIPTGQTRTITTTLAVPANYNGASPVTNTATVTSGNDSNPNNNTASASSNINIQQSADVVTTKTGPATIAPSGSITYTITTTNNGPNPAINVVVRDNIPPETTFSSASDGGTFANGVVTFPVIPSLASGASATRTVTVTAPASGGPLVNRASNTSDTPDPTSNNNDGSQPPAQVTTTLTQPPASADVVTTKIGPATVAPGGTITYTITTTNNGPSPATNVVVRDNIPPETTFSSASDGGTFANGVVTFPVLPSLASGASVTRTVTVTAPASGGPLVNRASNSSDTLDPTPNNNDGSQPPAQVTTTLTQTPASADVITVKNGPSTIAPGGSITYSINTTNNGPSPATNVIIRDTIPPETTFSSASDGGTFANGVVTFPAIPSLPSGVTVTRFVTVTAPSSGGPLVNRASNTSDTPDPTPNNNDGSQPPAQVTTTLTQPPASADIVTTKTGPATVAPGGTITYTITTTNNGPNPASNVVIRDNIPPETTFSSASDGGNFANGVVTFPVIPSLASGATVTRTVTVTAPASGGPLVNRASNTSDTPDPTPNNNDGSQPPAQVTTTLTQPSADVITTKTGPTTIASGGTITYTITTTNNGPSPATNVVIRDTIPPETTFGSASDGGTFANGVVTFPPIASVAPNTSVTRTVTVTAPASGGPLVNRASNTSDTPDPTPTNNDGSQPPAQVVTTITTTTNNADVVTTKTGPGTVAPGGTINYTITTANNGPSPATNVVIRDTLPAGAVFNSASDGGTFADGVVTFPAIPSLAPNASVTRTIAITAPTSGGPLVNRASNTSDTPDPTPANNDGSQPPAQVVTTITTTTPTTSADVVTTKTGPSTVAPGGTISYTITTRNNGPDPATNVIIRDTIPPETSFSSASDGGTFANGVVTFPIIPSLAPNTSVTRTIVITAPASGGPLVNRASNSSDTPDPTPVNNDGSQPPAQVITTITTPTTSADVVTTKTGQSTVAPGGTISYTITTRNNGPDPATNVIIRDTIPPETGFSSASDGGTFADGVVTFPAIPSLASNTTVTRTVTVTAPNSGGPLVNRASNTSNTPDPTPVNNDGSQPPAQVVTTITTTTTSADVVTTKTGPSTVAPGNTISYTITTRNNGPDPATNVIIRDTIPPETSFSSASDGGTFANGVVTFPAIPSLASNTSVTRTVTVTAPASGGPLVNRASNTSDTPDPTPINNDGSQPPAQVVTTLTTPTPPTPTDVVTTVTSPAQVDPGSTITYTITTQNNGSNPANNVIIRNTLPPGVTFNNASDGGILVDGVVIFPAIPTLPPGAIVTRTITVTVPTTSGPLVNQASSTSDTPDPTPSNNNGSQPSGQVTTTVTPQTTNVQVRQTGPTTPIPAGSNVTLTAGVTNNGTIPATNVILTNPLPPNVTFVSATPSQGTCTFANGSVTCNLGTINPSQTVNVAIVVTPTQPGNISNPISVSGTNIASSSSNNIATPIQVIPPLTDLEVTQTGPTEPQPVGNNITFNTVVANRGPVTGTAVTLTNPLPPNTTFVSATPTQGSCELTNNNVVCNLGDLSPGQSVNIATVVTPTAPGTITNQVSIASPNDSNPANNQASAIAQIVAREPRVRLVKRITSVTRSGSVSIFNDLVDDPTNENDNASGWSQFRPLGLVSLPVSAPVRSGDTVEYTIYFLSDGTTPADNVKICDAIPDNTTFLPDAFGSSQGIQLNLAGVISALTNDQDGDVGRFFSALAPLPTGNPCVNPNNPNGTVLFNIDRIPNTAGNNFGFVRFRVRIE